MNRTTTMTVAELRNLLADLPDWAAVEFLGMAEDGGPEEHEAYIEYAAGVLTIDVS